MSLAPPQSRATDARHAPAGRAAGGIRLALVFALALAAVPLAVFASLLLGSEPLTPGLVGEALAGRASEDVAAIVLGLRVPRTVLGLLCGAALGLAGALTQAHTRNPLADPGLLGVNAGASLGVVVAMTYLGVVAPAGYVWFGVLGATAAGAIVVGLANRVRILEPMTTVILTGSVLTALLASATSAVVLLNPRTMQTFDHWTVGTLAGRDLAVLAGIAPVLGLGAVLAVVGLGALPAAELGPELASSLGRNANRDRVVGLGAVVLLSGSATAACGTLGFLGLLAPHLARRLAGSRPIGTAVLSAITGAVILLVADVAGRVLLTTSEVNVGIMLALVGAPLFVVLARRLDADPRGAAR